MTNQTNNILPQMTNLIKKLNNKNIEDKMEIQNKNEFLYMKECYIRFMATVMPQSSEKLIRILDDKIRNGYTKVHLLISSPGGSVFHGLSLYNFIKGIPIEIDTYNFGSVDSIGVVLFCAGNKRFCVPHARFLIHGVSLTMNGGGMISFDEKNLDEKLKSLQIDQQNIAKVVGDTVNKKPHTIQKAMHDRTTLNPEEAKKYGLVHEIKSNLMPLNAELYTISDFDVINQQQSFPGFCSPQFQLPVKNENSTYTSYFDSGATYTDSYS